MLCRTTEEWVEKHNDGNSTIKSKEETILNMQLYIDSLKREIKEMSDDSKQLSDEFPIMSQ